MPEGVTRSMSPKDFLFSWGTVTIKDFAKGEAIKIIDNADDWETYVGVGGEATIMEITDESAMIEVTLAESSIGNQLLDAQRKAHKARIIGPPSVLAKTSGTSVYSGSKCVCLGPPKEVTIADTVQAKVWRFFVPAMKRNEGFAPEV